MSDAAHDQYRVGRFRLDAVPEFGGPRMLPGETLPRAPAASGNTLDHRDGEAFRRFYEEDTERGVRVVRALGRIE